MAGARLIALRVLRRPDGAAPESAAVPVPATGLIVGRAPECDLVLDDPLRLVSRQHARLQVDEAGVATLQCISATVPIVVNGTPLPPGGECAARPGDRLRIGGFELEIEAVEIEAPESPPPIAAPSPAVLAAPEPPPPPPPPPSPPTPTPPSPSPREDRRRRDDEVPATSAAAPLAEEPAVRSRLDQWFDLDTVADPWAPGSPLPAAPPPASAPAIVTPLSLAAAPVALPTFSPPVKTASSPTPARAAPAAAPAAAPTARPRRASAAKDDVLMRAFLDGAGLAPTANSPAAADAAWMKHLGALMRASTEGTLALLRSRAVTKRSIRAEGTRIVPRENNPLKFAPDAAEALGLLIDPQRAFGFLDPLDAVRDAHNDLLVHQLAMVAGMRAAAYELIARMGPEAIEAEQGPPAGLARWMPSLHEAALWRRHKQHHAHVMTHLDDDFEAVFGREFLLAYEAQSRLAAASRPAADRDT